MILALREAQDVWERAFSWKAEGLAGRWALDVDVIAKEKLGRAVGKALGIDMAMILDAPDVAVSVRLASMEAAQLIRTIPTDYIGRVSRAVYQSMRQQPFPEGRTLAEEIHLLGRVTKERAQVIARDQTSKMNTNINQTVRPRSAFKNTSGGRPKTAAWWVRRVGSTRRGTPCTGTTTCGTGRFSDGTNRRMTDIPAGRSSAAAWLWASWTAASFGRWRR